MKDSKLLIEKALNGERTYRTPVYDLLVNDAVIEHFSGEKLDGTNDVDVIYKAAANGMDCTRSIHSPSIEGAHSVDMHGNVLEHSRWTSWVIEHSHKTEDDWIRYMKEHLEELESTVPLSNEELANIQKSQLSLNDKLDGTVYLHSTPSTSINDLLFGYKMGLEHFSFLWFDNKELVKRFMKALEKKELQSIDTFANPKTSPLAIIYSDVAYKNGTMFSYETFREMGFFENVEKICSRVHSKGLKVIFHSDGNIMSIMDDLIACGIDGLNPLEKAAGMDVFEIRRKYPQLTIAGALDVTQLLPFGTAQDVRKETRKIIDEVGAEGRLLIGSSTEVEDNVPLENYLAFWDEVQRG